MPTRQIQFLIARRPRLVAIARNRVSAHARSWGAVIDEDLRATLDLLVSELVTNAVLHAEGVMVAVGVRLDGQRLRVEVEDDSPEPPAEPAQGDLAAWDEEGGRGLQLIHTLAAEHGWEPTSRGKRVWFELALPKPAPSRASAALLRRAARSARHRLPWPIPVYSAMAA